MSYLEQSLRKKVLFITGKGGVGKTSVALAIAVASSRRGKRALVVDWNPNDTERIDFPEVQQVERMHLAVLSCFHEYVIKKLRFEKIYELMFDNHVLKSFINAAPGLSETVIAGKIWDLFERRTHDLIIVDLPSSGHALSFFKSPLGVERLFAIGFVHREAKKIVDLFSSDQCQTDIVSLPEELPMKEAEQLKEKIELTLPLKLGYLILNQMTPDFGSLPESMGSEIPPEALPCYRLYLARKTLETEALTTAGRLGLPTVSLPLLPSSGTLNTVQSLARALLE